MCYNKNISLGTYILGLVGCYNLYINYNYKIEAIILAWVIQMQLVEYILWENQSCNDTNKITTKLGLIINHLEPIILWISILFLSSKEFPEWINLFMLGFCVITFFYTKDILDKKNKDISDECTTVTNESKPHLYWAWNSQHKSGMYYALFLICFNILIINGVDHGYHFSTLVTLSFFISAGIYKDSKSVGAMWCFISAYMPWIIPYFYEINLSL